MVPEFRRFSLCLLTAEGKLSILFHSDSREQCDLKLDYYADMFPKGIVDIYSRSCMQNIEVAA